MGGAYGGLPAVEQCLFHLLGLKMWPQREQSAAAAAIIWRHSGHLRLPR